ncbi:CIR protein PIR protein [Plasmodium vinckei lentum]|uniref:CIR protein PIR protein n=1 Tax=Plasmodium vinckei lentum TaxID=138297 RepID=A0A6V7RSY6_PLAVN|nr:CIR protein PIR protein [Plasmodium vinckei lentum]
MAKPSYNIKDVYKDIYTINNYFTETKQNGATIQRTDKIIHDYCHYGKTSGKGNCSDYIQMASSGVIHLLKTLKDKHHLEYDQLAEYAILWLRYKLNQKSPYHKTELNDFYTNHIEKNNDYNNKIKGDDTMTYKDIIDKKKDLMNINGMTKFSYPFSILLFLYSEINKSIPNCKTHLGQAKDFDTRFKEFNKDPNHIEGSSYNKLLSTLSNDYNHLKNIYYGKNKSCDFPSLPELTPKKISEKIPVKNSGQSSLEKSGKGSEKLSVQPTALIPEVTSSSSSILSTLIPGLSVVSVIPVFLGIAYKYSLFGVDKIFQRQYLRKKLKKIKKSMKINI